MYNFTYTGGIIRKMVNVLFSNIAHLFKRVEKRIIKKRIISEFLGQCWPSEIFHVPVFLK